jgi:hypothetical protein
MGFGFFGGAILFMAFSNRSHASGTVSTASASLRFTRFLRGAAMSASPKSERLRLPLFHSVQPINSDILAGIGAVTVAWGGIETLVNQAIGRTLRLSLKEEAAVTTGILLKTRMEMLQDAIKAARMGNVRRVEINSIIAGIKGVQGDRNFLSHALWMRDGYDHVKGYVGRRNVAGYRLERWNEQDLLSLAHRITKLEERLFWWVHLSARDFVRVLASQRKPQSRSQRNHDAVPQGYASAKPKHPPRPSRA